jgi:hypothetical protein
VHPPTKSCASAIRSNLLIGIALSFASSSELRSPLSCLSALSPKPMGHREWNNHLSITRLDVRLK